METDLETTVPELIVPRGLSNSGKSTWAKKWVAEAPEKRRRVSRDDIRAAGFNISTQAGEEEKLVTQFQHACITMLLSAGFSVVVDDMHLRPSYIRPLHNIAKELGAKLVIKEFPIDLETAIARAEKRAAEGGLAVPEEAIVRMFEKYTNNGAFIPLPDFDAPVKLHKGNRAAILKMLEPYVPDRTKPLAVIVDIDGTLTIGIHPDRSPYEWAKVGLDLPNEHVIDIVRLLHQSGYLVLVTSGRDGVCRPETIEWLNRHEIPWDALFMRAEGDMAGDDVVKAEIFNREIRDNYNVRAVFDDRLRVVRTWHALGLPLFRIGDPDANF